MTLYSYILKQFCLALVFALGGIAIVVFPALTVSAVVKLPGVGVEALLRYLPLLAIQEVPYLVPMGFLLAVVSTFGRLAADNEFTAIRMAGIHPLRTLVPVFGVAVVLSLITAWLLTDVRPDWKHAQGAYRRNAVREALQTLYPGRTRIEVGEFLLDAAGREGNLFHDVLIYLPREDGEQAPRLVADHVLLGFDGDVLSMQFGNARWVRGGRDIQIERPSIEIPLDVLAPISDEPRGNPKYLRSSQILARLADRDNGLSAEGVRIHRFEYHRRFAMSVTYILFLVLGVPTGLWLRKGTQLGALAVAMLYAVVYYSMSMRLSQLLGREGYVPVPVAAWAATAIGGLIGLVLLLRVVRR